MTQTAQPRSWVTLNETGKDLSVQKPEEEDNWSLLLSVFDNLNNLCEKLSKLEYLLARMSIEQILYHNGKGVTK